VGGSFVGISLNQRTRWRIGMGLCVFTAVFLGTSWAMSPGSSIDGFLAISLPIIVLLYAASYSAVHGYLPTEEGPGTVTRRQASRGRTISAVLVLAGFIWMLLVSIVFLFMGQLKLGGIGLGSAVAFVSGALPSPFTPVRIIVVFIGLVVASIFYVL